MISRLVTVDLILTVSLRVCERELLPITTDEFQLYRDILRVLDGWAKTIERQGLAVSLETIATNAVEMAPKDYPTALHPLMGLIATGYELISRSRDIESYLSFDRSLALLKQPTESEITLALNDHEFIGFKDAAAQITGLERSADGQKLLKEFLDWFRDNFTDGSSEARTLLDEVISGDRRMTKAAVRLFLEGGHFDNWDLTYRTGKAKERRENAKKSANP